MYYDYRSDGSFPAKVTNTCARCNSPCNTLNLTLLISIIIFSIYYLILILFYFYSKKDYYELDYVCKRCPYPCDTCFNVVDDLNKVRYLTCDNVCQMPDNRTNKTTC